MNLHKTMDINYKKRGELFDTEMVVTFTVALVCMLLFSFFPVKNPFQEVVLSLVFFFLVPYLYIKIILKKKMFEFGFQLTKWKEGFIFMMFCFFVMGIFFYLVFNYTDFESVYFLGKYKLVNSFWYLLIYEFLVVNLFVLLYESFFRGFLMFYFKKKFDVYAVFIQFLMFLIFLDLLERLSLDYIFYIMTALLSGLIAYKSKSLVYSYFFSIIVLIASDLIYLKMIK